jgi:hypothetical protein
MPHNHKQLFRKEYEVNTNRLMTALPEYGIPYLCETMALQTLQNVLEAAQLANRQSLDWVAGKILPRYSYAGQLEPPVTEDGYEWFCGLVFAVPHGEVAILVPWSRDWGLYEESDVPARTATVYARGERIPAEIDFLLQRFAETIKAMWEKFL